MSGAACVDCLYSKILWRKGDKFRGGFRNDEMERPSTAIECRRHAPRGPVVVPDNTYEVSKFPVQDGDDWCGEFLHIESGRARDNGPLWETSTKDKF